MATPAAATRPSRLFLRQTASSSGTTGTSTAIGDSAEALPRALAPPTAHLAFLRCPPGVPFIPFNCFAPGVPRGSVECRGRQLYSAYAGGVTTAISAPLGSSLVVGQAAAFTVGLGVGPWHRATPAC